MTVLLNLELQVGEQKETLGVFSRRKDFVLCLCIPWGLIRRDESKAGNSAITFCQELRSKDLMFSLEPDGMRLKNCVCQDLPGPNASQTTVLAFAPPASETEKQLLPAAGGRHGHTQPSAAS